MTKDGFQAYLYIVILIHEISTGRALHQHCRVQNSSPLQA